MGAVLLPPYEFHQKTINKVNAIRELKFYKFLEDFEVWICMKTVTSIVLVSSLISLYQLYLSFAQNPFKFKLNYALHHTHDLKQSDQKLNIWERRVKNIDFHFQTPVVALIPVFYGLESPSV